MKSGVILPGRTDSGNSMASTDQPPNWSDLVGMKADEAKKKIQEETPPPSDGNDSVRRPLAAAVHNFNIAVRLSQQLNSVELEAKAWYGKGSSLRNTNRRLHEEDINECFSRYEQLITQVPNSRAHIEGLFATKLTRSEHQQEETPEMEIQRLQKRLGAEESPILLADIHFSLGQWFLQNQEFVKAEENLRQSIKQWHLVPYVQNSHSVYQVTAQLSLAPAFQWLQLCLAKQGKPLEALMWAERARARVLRFVFMNDDVDKFEEDDNMAQERIMTALNVCKESVVAVIYSFVGTDLLIWVLKPGLPPTVHQIFLDDDEIGFLNVDEVQASLKIEENLALMLGKMSTSSSSNSATRHELSMFHKLLIEPIKQELLGCNTVVLIPVQALHRVPWTALMDEHARDGEKYLIQRHAVVIAPSLLAFEFCSQNWAKVMSKNESNHDKILVVANPWPLSLWKLAPLSGAVAEAAAIVKLVKAYTGLVPVICNGEQAVRETVVKNLSKAKWVHMACHNIVNEMYNAGALMLAQPAMKHVVGVMATTCSWAYDRPSNTFATQVSEGRVIHQGTNFASLVGQPMSEINTRDEEIRGVLSAQQLTQCQLEAHGVVLSACSTAEGVLIGEEGILGLARALLVAGAPAVLVSLWDVRDLGTSKLMTQVYKKLMMSRPPCNLASAHRQAIMSMIGKEGIQVRDWAAFQIIGTPDVMFPCVTGSRSWLHNPNYAIVTFLVMTVSILVAILLR